MENINKLFDTLSFDPRLDAKHLFFPKPQGLNFVTYKKLIEKALLEQLKIDASLIMEISCFAGQGILVSLLANTDITSLIGSVISLNYGTVNPQTKTVIVTDKIPSTTRQINIRFQNVPPSHRSEEKFKEFCETISYSPIQEHVPQLYSCSMNVSDMFGLPDSCGSANYEFLPQSIFDTVFVSKQSQGWVSNLYQDQHHPRFLLPAKKDFCKICNCNGHDTDLCYSTNAGLLDPAEVKSPAKKALASKQCSVVMKDDTTRVYVNGLFIKSEDVAKKTESKEVISPFKPVNTKATKAKGRGKT